MRALVGSLKASLQRAGSNLVDVLPEVRELGELYWVKLGVTVPVPLDGRQPAAGYIKQYLRAAGWKVHRLAFQKRYVAFFVSKAVSRPARKR